jgi:hypothetical protein
MPAEPMMFKNEAADALWKDWYDNRDPIRTLPENDARIGQRLGANIHRIASLFAVTDKAIEITVPHLEAAIALVEWQFDVVREHARRWGANPEAKLDALIVECLEYGDATRSDISKYVGRRYSQREIKLSLDSVLSMEQAVVVSPGVYGLPCEE